MGTFFSCVATRPIEHKRMKPRNIAIMFFCIFAAAALLATLHVRSQMEGRSMESQWQTTIDDLQTASSAAYIQSLHYDAYARQAAIDHDASREHLFPALAQSERIHEQMCARALKLFGSSYTPPEATTYSTTDTDTAATTAGNLSHTLTSVRTRHRLSQGSAATRAIESGNRYVARIFIWIDGSNRRHIELLEHSGRRSSPSEGIMEYLVCPKCGNIYHTASYDIYCPFCRTHYSDFKRF